MPRKSKQSVNTKRRAQRKLDAFFSSSPARSTSAATQQSSPTRPTAAQKRKRVERGSFNEKNSPEPSGVIKDDEGSQSSDAGAIRFEPQVLEISSSEGEQEAAPRPSHANKGKKRARRAHSEDSASPVMSEAEAEDVYVRKGKRVAKEKVVIFDSDEEEEQPRRRKLIKGERPYSPVRDENDLMEELDEERILESRLRTRDKRSTFQKNLEKLKRKKRGEALRSDSSASESEGEDAVVQPFAGAKPHAGSGVESGDSDDDNGQDDTFIIEDDSAAAIELPAEFSMNTYQDLLHHFKIVCQLFVHIAVHDADDRDDVATRLERNQYFSVPLKITRRKLGGMRDSLVAGSTWRPNFRKALDTYPDLEVQGLEFTVLGCAACNLGGRKSTLQGRLSGDPYDKLTFESLAEDQSSSDEDEDETRALPKQFDLGRFCAKRTRTYHKFTHWEYHLFHALNDEVEALKAKEAGRSFVRVAYAAGKQPPKDLSDADAIMDWLDERQVINLQWHEIKTMMDDARNLEVKGGRGGDLDSD
ncbi:hypothetical protein BC628DRAFT_1353507 [Trametes gibbosa]|nr:hypothetical protein BC628DRAFT_1353507 [Trametes gibbosa]